MLDIQRAIWEMLHRDGTVQGIVGEQIYPHMADQRDESAEQPAYIVYHVIGKVIERHIKGPIPLAETRLQVDAYAKTYEVAQQLANGINGATDGFRGEVTTTDGTLTIRNVHVDSWEEFYETGNTASKQGWHRVSMDLLVWHEHTIPLFVQ